MNKKLSNLIFEIILGKKKRTPSGSLKIANEGDEMKVNLFKCLLKFVFCTV